MNTRQLGNSDLYITPSGFGVWAIGFSPSEKADLSRGYETMPTQKLVGCSNCGHEWIQDLPDVSPAEMAQLKAAFDDTEVIFQCPNCQSDVRVVRWDIPDLPDPPEQFLAEPSE